MLISSLQNARVKHVVRLSSRRYRDAQRQTIVEGIRETSRALEAGIIPSEAYICPDLIAGQAAAAVVNRLQQFNLSGETGLFEVTPSVFAKMAFRGESGGLLLVINYPEHTPEELLQRDDPFLVVLENAEKPGNVGAILRTADAAGVSGMILCPEDGRGTDLFNPNVIRASLGAVFTVPVITMAAREAVVWLKGAGIQIVASTPYASALYTDVSLRGPVAVVMGSEALGLSRHWLDAADMQVRIPMSGVVDSLNLSVSTALILYEVVRQRSRNDEKD
ncbi:MAG: RNA methyltransferase [Candidatus Promineifilaceae bacterium]|nr:RNA methyltransferase [Candidatus Promineifilaceae bacterium]